MDGDKIDMKNLKIKMKLNYFIKIIFFICIYYSINAQVVEIVYPEDDDGVTDALGRFHFIGLGFEELYYKLNSFNQVIQSKNNKIESNSFYSPQIYFEYSNNLIGNGRFAENRNLVFHLKGKLINLNNSFEQNLLYNSSNEILKYSNNLTLKGLEIEMNTSYNLNIKNRKNLYPLALFGINIFYYNSNKFEEQISSLTNTQLQIDGFEYNKNNDKYNKSSFGKNFEVAINFGLKENFQIRIKDFDEKIILNNEYNKLNIEIGAIYMYRLMNSIPNLSSHQFKVYFSANIALPLFKMPNL
ncbi:MAG: hypothetical protein NTW25_00825 [Candidatus Kapabacteria bacterium]|nr:hypothetical protein [Candidatus Kapabacteria bacterium]